MKLVPNTPVHIIYASTSGNTQLVVEKVGEVWQATGMEVILHRSENCDPQVIKDNTLFLLATSTWEHGQLNPFFDKIFAALDEIDCTNKSAAFIGLGDKRYEPVLFCGGMQLLREKFLARGGREIGQPLKINGEPHALLETEVTNWAKNTL
jgi:flavodoxin